jgi:7,8-dihydropterin-6-yl-methyl-4-(beta-D-ribofuranosyl)aminobenzene 5'-phosphate synthase
MLRGLQFIRDRQPYYAHPDVFRRRAMKRPDGSMLKARTLAAVSWSPLHSLTPTLLEKGTEPDIGT